MLEGCLCFGIMLSTETETWQDSLEGGKEQHRGDGALGYWTFALECDEQT